MKKSSELAELKGVKKTAVFCNLNYQPNQFGGLKNIVCFLKLKIGTSFHWKP